MTEHLQNGAMKDHIRNIHRNILTRTEIIENVSCLKKIKKKQKIYEALIISKETQRINKQNKDFSNVVLKLKHLFTNVEIIS